MENFDFNIKNYSIKNIEDFFNFDRLYTEDDINKNVQSMKDNLLSCKELYSQHNEITHFLNKSREMLLLNIHTTSHNFNPPKQIDMNNVYNYKYASGLVNPIERQIQKKCVCINSLFRTNYFKSESYSFDYIFPTPVENVISMKVSFVEIPIFWYDISSKKKNNTFTINVSNMQKDSGSGLVAVPDTTNLIVIEDGNYTSGALVTYLNNYFDSTKNGLDYLICSISDINSKVVFRAKVPADLSEDDVSPFTSGNAYYSPNFTYQVIFNETPFFDTEHNYTNPNTEQYAAYLKSAASILGFKYNTYTVTPANTHIDYSSATTYYAYLQSEYAYGKYEYQYLFLEINDYHNNFTTDSVISLVCNKNYVSNNVISVIPITGNSNTIMFNNSSDGIIKCRDYFGPVRLTKLTIRILNQYGEVLDLNGYDYFIILQLQQLYNNYAS
jgi:hypothetical protein